MSAEDELGQLYYETNQPSLTIYCSTSPVTINLAKILINLLWLGVLKSGVRVTPPFLMTSPENSWMYRSSRNCGAR